MKNTDMKYLFKETEYNIESSILSYSLSLNYL